MAAISLRLSSQLDVCNRGLAKKASFTSTEPSLITTETASGACFTVELVITDRRPREGCLVLHSFLCWLQVRSSPPSPPQCTKQGSHRCEHVQRASRTGRLAVRGIATAAEVDAPVRARANTPDQPHMKACARPSARVCAISPSDGPLVAVRACSARKLGAHAHPHVRGARGAGGGGAAWRGSGWRRRITKRSWRCCTPG